MSSPRTILCVDDNAALVDNLREILEDAGYRVVGAASCAEALDPSRPPFDVGLVDVRLPDGDGIALAARLLERNPESQVILLTGYATLESAAAAVRAGAWAYLTKPCSPHDILVAVEQALRQIEAIEDKREYQRRAQMAEKLAAIGTLTAGLSHEIKNPLNAAGLQLAVLERRLRKLPPEAQASLQEPLRLVQNEIVRLNRVLEEFLQFARPREITTTRVSLADMLQHVSDLLAPQAAAVEIALERRWPQSAWVMGDEVLLQQAVMNLALNAIQASPPGGVVTLSAAVARDDIQLTIDDSGPGIPEGLRPRIFEPFFTTKPAGSGLGLPLVHSIVEQHGGSISVERSPQGGARFVLRLPAATAP